MTLLIEELDLSDETAYAAWYAAYAEGESAGRAYPTTFAFEEIRAMLRGPSLAADHFGLQARLDGRVVGVATLKLPKLDNTETAEFHLNVVPAHRRNGAGSALLAEVEGRARAAGRKVLIGMTGYPIDGPVDGAGSAQVEFLFSRGFTFGLGDVQRVLDLPAPAALLDSLLEQGAARQGDYTLRQFGDRVPDDIIESYGALVGSLMTEAPMGEIEREAEVYDPARIRSDEANLAAAGRSRVATVALSSAGDVVGYTELVIASYEPGKVYQWGTLVHRDHRGHKLGLTLKVRNLQLLQDKHPDLKLVRTWNADSNEHMIAVNDAMGFRPVERAGEFHKKLAG
jgi:GNAT superfamily N-acetyltransferase